MIQKEDRTVVVLVHGVGDPAPGEVLRDFTATLEADDDCQLKLMGPTIVRQLEDSSLPELPLRHFFPVHLILGELGGRSVVFAEVFWGEVSRIPHGIVGVLRGLFQVIFGLGAIMIGDRGKGKPKPFDRLTALIAWLGSEVLRGPVLAINLLLSLTLLILVVLALCSEMDASMWTEVDSKWAPLVAFAAGFSVIGVGVRMLWRIRDNAHFEGYQRLMEWRVFAWSCVLVGFVWPIRGWWLEVKTWQAWAKIAFDPLLISFGFVSCCLMLLTILYLVTRLPWCNDEERASMSARAMALALQFWLWGMIVPSLWLSALHLVGRESRPGEKTWLTRYYEAVPSDGSQWLLLPFIVVSFSAAWIWRRRKVSRLARIEKPNSQRSGKMDVGVAPRLLVAPLIRETLIAGSLYIGVAVIMIYFDERLEWMNVSLLPAGLLLRIREIELVMIPLTVFLVGSSFLLEGVRTVLDVGNDVIHYFRVRVAEGERAQDTREDGYERLRPIRGRFNEVVRFLDREFGFNKLIVIAHSQGSVLACDELAQSSFGHQPEWVRSMDLRFVTMGSPLAHLYQHYFPSAYPGWGESHWDKLSTRLTRWLNLYRVDDFVGQRVGVESSVEKERLHLKEIAVGTGGHMNYWRDRRVIRAIIESDVFGNKEKGQ